MEGKRGALSYRFLHGVSVLPEFVDETHEGDAVEHGHAVDRGDDILDVDAQPVVFTQSDAGTILLVPTPKQRRGYAGYSRGKRTG